MPLRVGVEQAFFVVATLLALTFTVSAEFGFRSFFDYVRPETLGGIMFGLGIFLGYLGIPLLLINLLLRHRRLWFLRLLSCFAAVLSSAFLAQYV